jgi:hypothetical protein
MNNDVRELNEAELEGVTGGMDCKTGHAIAETYRLAGAVLGALGNHEGANRMYGTAYGVSVGACNYPH